MIEDPVVKKFVRESLCSFATLAIGGALQAQSVCTESTGKAIVSLLGSDDSIAVDLGDIANGFPNLTVGEIKAILALADQLQQMATGQNSIMPILFKASRQVPKLL